MSKDSGRKHYKCFKYCQSHISEIFPVFHFTTEERGTPITSTLPGSTTFPSNFFWSGHSWPTVLILSLKYLLRFWTETTFAQTQSLLPSSTEFARYCLLNLLASILAAGLVGGWPGWPRKHFPSSKWCMIAILNVRKSWGGCLTFKMAKEFRRHTSNP